MKEILGLANKLFPNGHKDYNKITIDEMELHSSKNADYARGGDPLGNFVRIANILAQYPNLKLSDPAVVAVVYALKQFDAAMWMLNGDYEGSVENVDTRLGDVSVYMKLARILHRQ